MNKDIFLVTYEATFWDVNKPSKLKQEQVEFDHNDLISLQQGEIVLGIQEKIKKSNHNYQAVIVINFWKLGL